MSLTIYQTDGTTQLAMIQFLPVYPGQSAAQGFVIKNTGEASAKEVLLAIIAAGATDLEQWLTGTVNTSVGDVAFDFITGPAALPDMAPGDTVSGVLTVSVPSDSAPLLTPVVAALDVSALKAG